MERAQKVLYLVADPVTEAWVRRLNPTAESLHGCYAEGKPRAESYAAMVSRILAHVRKGATVCVAFYGHPGVFVQPSHEAIRLAHREGFAAKMLPGISAEDCIFADLGVDPAQEGCQSFEATDFLLRRQRFNPCSALILWQVGVIGEFSVRMSGSYDTGGLQLLATRLRRHYPTDHEVVVYEAAQYPVCAPTILRIPISDLPSVAMPPLATLYVPPGLPAAVDREMFAQLTRRTGFRVRGRRRRREHRN
jgi:uncharacterized protein YabN with tetrapyrrole methylase and pyrophosphatase domain